MTDISGQLIVAGLIVAAALGYLVRQTWRTWKGGKAGCGGSCACSTGKKADASRITLVPVDQLTVRRDRSGR